MVMGVIANIEVRYRCATCLLPLTIVVVEGNVRLLPALFAYV